MVKRAATMLQAARAAGARVASAALRRLLPRGVLSQLTILAIVSVLVVIVIGRVTEGVRRSPQLALGDIDVVTERVVTLVDLLQQAPEAARANILAWANAKEPKVAVLDPGAAAAFRERAHPPSVFRRLVRELFPQDSAFPPGSELLIEDGTWMLLVPVDERTHLLAVDVPNQILTNDFVGPVTYYLLGLMVLLVLLRAYSRRTFLGPLARISAEAKQASGLENGSFQIERGSSEILALTEALNEMRSRVRDLLETRTRMLRSVSHDLRTPLTRLRQRTERLEDADLQARMLSDIRHIDALIEATLDYLRVDATEEARERLDVASLLQTIQADFSDVGADVTYEGPDRFVAHVRPIAVTRAVNNLCDNALKFGTRAAIRLFGDDTTVTIAVADDGPGIPAEMWPRVVEPFFKIDASRRRGGDAAASPGVGLGLSIVAEIIAAHGGTLQFAPNDPHGLLAAITLPRFG